MSWIVQTLLKNRLQIKTTPDLNSDSYLDIIMMESVISRLEREGLFSELDIAILYYVSDGMSLRKLGEVVGKSGITVSRHFNSLCSRIGYTMGGYFTDVGYLEMMKDKYKLTDEEIETLRVHMLGKHKHRIVRSKK